MPADIYIDGYRGNEATIRFKIELYEGNKKIEDLVLSEKTYSNSKWEGDVFRYSLKDSVLDDIYNNAQN